MASVRVPQDLSPGAVQLIATFDAGPLGGIVEAQREVAVLPPPG